MAETRVAGAIYDLGYQRYTGTTHGRGYAVRALAKYTFSTAFGIGRSDKAKTLPVAILAIVVLPALGQIAVASASGQFAFINYSLFMQIAALMITLFGATQAPEVVVADRQQGVLSLYLSRPVTSSDYATAKLIGLTAAMLVITLTPQIILFLGRVGLDPAPFTIIKTEWRKLLPIVGGALLTSIFISSISLLLASFVTRRGYGSASIIAFFLLLPAIVEMFRSVTSGSVKRYSVLVHPIYLITGFCNWLFQIEANRRSAVSRAELPGSYYFYVMFGVSVVCSYLLLRRYRRLDA